MVTFILLIIVAVAWIWGIKCIFSTGHIFQKAGDWVENNLHEWVYKPTIGCQACMSSIHGTLWFWTYGIVVLNAETLLSKVILWIVYLLCLCGVNFMLLESIYKEPEVKEEEEKE
jgi:hypothetical protein